MKKILTLLLITYSVVSTAQETGSITDSRDGKVYKTVVIGTQTWMAENLNVSKFRNGDPIPEAKTNEEWAKAGENKQPAWCYYNNDTANGSKYGKLYNWFAINDPRGLAPEGFHIPSDQEWTMLTDYLGSEDQAGTKMKSKNTWQKKGIGTNESGFSGLPGGMRFYDGAFYVIGNNGYWWSSTDDWSYSAFYRLLSFDSVSMGRDASDKPTGLSVRCLKD